MTLGERIRSARINMGMTTEELGKAIGVERSAITKYEKGRVTNIPPDKIEALAAALDVTPGYLMGWTDMPGQMDVLDTPGFTSEERAADYAESIANSARISGKRKALEELVSNATEKEIDLITQIVIAVIESRK